MLVTTAFAYVLLVALGVVLFVVAGASCIVLAGRFCSCSSLEDCVFVVDVVVVVVVVVGRKLGSGLLHLEMTECFNHTWNRLVC